MATIDNAWGKGVIYTAGIDLAAQKPLDSRIAVQTIAERDAHVTSNRAFEGMQVYVVDNATTYILKDGAWKVLVDSDLIVNNLTAGGSDKVLSAEQGKVLREAIDSIQGGELSVPVASADKIGGIKSSAAEKDEVSVSAEGIASISRVSSADKLTNAATIELTGDATGSVEFDGSAKATIEVTVADNSHAHTIENVTGLQEALNLKAPLESPAFTGTPTAPTATAGDNSTNVATTAFVNTAIAAHVADVATALIFKGIVDAEHPLPSEGMKAGWLYVVGAAGTYAEHVCEAGDMLIYGTDNQWYVVQKNIDGAVTGPESAVANQVAVFDGSTGKVIKDSGLTLGQSVPDASVWKIGDDVTDAVHGLMTPAQKAKLDGIAEGAEVNQNAFTSIKVGDVTLAADSKTDSFELAGTGLNIGVDGKKITLTVAEYELATAEKNGLLSKEDFSKLAGIEAGAQKNVKADWNATEGDAEILNKPTTMASPYGLTVTAGSKSVSYDGSSAKEINITTDDISAMPLIDSGTAGHLVKVDATNNTVADAGFSLPAPDTEHVGQYLGIQEDGTYALKTVGMSEVSGLVSALGTKVDKVTGVENNLMAFGANGAIADSGLAKDKLVTTEDTVTFQCTL